jgi:hypothetical protein
MYLKEIFLNVDDSQGVIHWAHLQVGTEYLE